MHLGMNAEEVCAALRTTVLFYMDFRFVGLQWLKKKILTLSLNIFNDKFLWSRYM